VERRYDITISLGQSVMKQHLATILWLMDDGIQQQT
jgi:hypothetical protein